MTEEQLIEKLKILKQIRPSKQAQEKGLKLLLQKVDEKFSQAQEPAEVKQYLLRRGWLVINNKLAAITEMTTATLAGTRQFAVNLFRFYYSHVLASVLITVVVFSAFGALAGISASRALPDDKPLYTLKQALEKTQLALSFSAAKKTEVKVNLLARRVEEIDRLVEKTASKPEKDGQVVSKAIQHTQSEIESFKNDITELAQKKKDDDIQDLIKLVDEKVNYYKIALDEVGDELPENIKEAVGSDVKALNSALSEISKVIENLPADEQIEGAADINEDISDLDNVFITGKETASTTISTTDLLINNREAIETSSTKSFIPSIVEPEEKFSVEKDTYKVHIGD